MKLRSMKCIGIVIMILAHPIGYKFWFEFKEFLPYEEPLYDRTFMGIMIWAGILEFFLFGLSLFVMGMIKDKKN